MAKDQVGKTKERERDAETPNNVDGTFAMSSPSVIPPTPWLGVTFAFGIGGERCDGQYQQQHDEKRQAAHVCLPPPPGIIEAEPKDVVPSQR